MQAPEESVEETRSFVIRYELKLRARTSKEAEATFWAYTCGGDNEGQIEGQFFHVTEVVREGAFPNLLPIRDEIVPGAPPHVNPRIGDDHLEAQYEEQQ